MDKKLIKTFFEKHSSIEFFHTEEVVYQSFPEYSSFKLCINSYLDFMWDGEKEHMFFQFQIRPPATPRWNYWLELDGDSILSGSFEPPHEWILNDLRHLEEYNKLKYILTNGLPTANAYSAEND